MTKRLILVGLMMVAGCGYPDRRNADVVVESEELAPAAVFALKWWKAATSDVLSEVRTQCGEINHCVTIRFDRVPPGRLARTTNEGFPTSGKSSSLIKVRNDRTFTAAELDTIVSHELGHTMDMQHTDDLEDLMYPYGTNRACINDSTLVQWRDLYGDNGKTKAVCDYDVEQPQVGKE
jgi:hypothetical protein